MLSALREGQAETTGVRCWRAKWEILEKQEELLREGANLKAKCPKKQKGEYFPRNPEASSKNVPKPLRAAGVINKAGGRKPPYENTKGQASLIFRPLKFTSVTLSRTEFSL